MRHMKSDGRLTARLSASKYQQREQLHLIEENTSYAHNQQNV